MAKSSCQLVLNFILTKKVVLSNIWHVVSKYDIKNKQKSLFVFCPCLNQCALVIISFSAYHPLFFSVFMVTFSSGSGVHFFDVISASRLISIYWLLAIGCPRSWLDCTL